MNRSRSLRRSSSPAALAVLGGLLLAAPAARAQSALTTLSPSVRGVVSAGGGESVACAGPVSVTTRQVTPTGVVVAVDARGLTCTGLTTGASYSNTGVANLTRSLAAQDVVRTTFAVYRDVPGGFRSARTALLTLTLTYDLVTGAATGATGAVGDP
jgi:hypothetical protein